VYYTPHYSVAILDTNKGFSHMVFIHYLWSFPQVQWADLVAQRTEELLGFLAPELPNSSEKDPF
jgi:RES domain-containing protein